MNNDREKEMIQRIKESLIKEGVSEKIITESKQYGIGSAKSYLEALVDLRLEGRDLPKTQEVWEGMKLQINFLTSSLLRASDDYAKLESRFRGSKEDGRERLKDIVEKDKESKKLFTDETYLMQIQALRNIEARERTSVFKLTVIDVDSIWGEDDFSLGIFSSKEKAEKSFLNFMNSDEYNKDRYKSHISEVKIDEDTEDL